MESPKKGSGRKPAAPSAAVEHQAAPETAQAAPAKPRRHRPGNFVLGWRWKLIGLIMATGFSLVGSLGQYLAVDNWNEQATQINNDISASSERVVTLRDAQSNYFSSYSEANILLGLNQTNTTGGTQMIPLLFKMSLIHRARPIRQILAEMEAVGAADYKSTMEKYDSLATAVQGDFSHANYVALMVFEQGIVDNAGKIENNLRENVFDLQQKKAVIEGIRDTRRYWFTMLMALGTVLLLAANLLSEMKPAKAAPSA